MKRMLCLLLALFPLLLTLTLLGIALLAGMRYLHAWLPVLLLSQLLDAFFVWKHRWKGLTASVLLGCLPLIWGRRCAFSASFSQRITPAPMCCARS